MTEFTTTKELTHAMHLVNFPKLRIKKYDQGYCPEILVRQWYGLNRWKHIISVAGMEYAPWYFKTYQDAIGEAKIFFGWDLLRGYSQHNTNTPSCTSSEHQQ